ncbi:MAG: transcription-repair coupling factor [Phycisphaerae bacterium]|nr:transcription-repair coupling factor [Phycisphaerae bacterium]
MNASASGQTASAWLARLETDPSVRRLVEEIRAGGDVTARGAHGSSTTLVAGALARSMRDAADPIPTLLLVVAHLDDADEAAAELASCSLDVAVFPAIEALPGETAASLELVAARLGLARRLVLHAQGIEGDEGRLPDVIVAPMPALMQRVPDAKRLATVLRTLRVGQRVDSRELAAWLDAGGYKRVEAIESPGEFALRGGIVDIFAPGAETAIRLDLFGDEIERIFEVDLATQASDRSIRHAELVSASLDAIQSDVGTRSVAELLPKGTVTVLAELAEIVEQGRGYFERVHDSRGIDGPPRVLQSLTAASRAMVQINQFSATSISGRLVELPVSTLPVFHDEVKEAFIELAYLGSRHDIAIYCDTPGELQRTGELLAEHAKAARAGVIEAHLHRGFLWGGEGSPPGTPALAFVPQSEVLHRYGMRRRAAKGLRGGRAREAFVTFDPGDYVVHRDHGIARFVGLQTLAQLKLTPTAREKGIERASAEDEFLTLEFDGGTRLHVPASKIELVQKYIGAGGAKPTLSTLGGKRWRNAREQVREAVKDLAGELLRVQAAREATSGIRYPADTAWQKEFEAEFPYEETEDQLSAIEATKRDMTSERPMDRLICGDVGFGKTEVAIRAAFKAVEFGKQVAVLVPTTVLAEQHERTFRDRFRAYPFSIESLSRFKTDGEQRETLDRLAKGQVDVVIGTHRLLSKDVHFKDLGLVIVDEEQRFGVEHKSRLLEFRLTADVLTLSATPIPRTLHMAMLGIRDISSLTTAPLDRRAIVTEVIPFNAHRVKQALERELAREGQIFFVHNRVNDIHSIALRIKELVPKAQIVVGHGQMSPKELEEVMLTFMRRKADILVSTTIIESGIDIPTANTMFIHNAHMFGLAELHQLRGRVGRWKHRAYCYMLLPEQKTITEEAMKRLKAIEDYSMLGAGFKIAMRDLEIRGAGNLLGAEQSGHIAAVGYEMYCQLLEQAVGELKSQKRLSPIDTAIDIGVGGAIPRGYIPSDGRRMEAYRRIGQADSLEALGKVVQDITSAYGEPPASVKTLIELAEVRLMATSLGIRSVTRRDADVIFRTSRPRDLETALVGVQGSVRLVGQADGDGLTEVYLRPPPAFLEPKSLMLVLRRRLARGATV